MFTNIHLSNNLFYTAGINYLLHFMVWFNTPIQIQITFLVLCDYLALNSVASFLGMRFVHLRIYKFLPSVLAVPRHDMISTTSCHILAFLTQLCLHQHCHSSCIQAGEFGMLKKIVFNTFKTKPTSSPDSQWLQLQLSPTSSAINTRKSHLSS